MRSFGIKFRFWLRAQWLKRVKRANYRPATPIFFIHLPKTAGTSFRNMLYGQIDPVVCFPGMEDLGRNGGHYHSFEQTRQLLQQTSRNVLFLSGHYPFAAGELLEKTPQYYVFLREPLSRTVSNLRHFQRQLRGPDQPDLIQLFDQHRAHLQNLQTRFLAVGALDQLEIFYHPRLDDEQYLEMAKINLEKCAFIGIAERFPESVAYAEHLLNIKLGRPLKRNRAPQRRQETDDRLLAHIQPFLQLDLELYQYALRLFDRQLSLIRQQ